MKTIFAGDATGIHPIVGNDLRVVAFCGPSGRPAPTFCVENPPTNKKFSAADVRRYPQKRFEKSPWIYEKFIDIEKIYVIFIPCRIVTKSDK